MSNYWGKEGQGIDRVRVFDSKSKSQDASQRVGNYVERFDIVGLQHRPLYHL